MQIAVCFLTDGFFRYALLMNKSSHKGGNTSEYNVWICEGIKFRTE